MAKRPKKKQTSTGLVRQQLHLTVAQDQALRTEARRTAITVSARLRMLIDEHLAKQPPTP
jgi:hypothetical protein